MVHLLDTVHREVSLMVNIPLSQDIFFLKIDRMRVPRFFSNLNIKFHKEKKKKQSVIPFLYESHAGSHMLRLRISKTTLRHVIGMNGDQIRQVRNNV